MIYDMIIFYNIVLFIMFIIIWNCFQHIVLVIVLALRIAIPEIPGWLATEMAKVEFQRREAIKNAHAPLLVSLW